MELLERDEPLAVLADAASRAARGEGAVVLVTGEPGIGKTSLITRFAQDVGSGRVLWGSCEDLSIPRPLGPLRFLIGPVSGRLRAVLDRGESVADVHAALLDDLRLPPHPTLLVVEDLHWADSATIDALTVVARRIGRLPGLLVLTYRPEDLAPSHPLHPLLGAVHADVARHVPLTPLTPAAVAALAGDERAASVYALTGGNPLYVTELLSHASGSLPPSVANAVLARATRLDPPARDLVELLSVVPTRVRTELLDSIRPSWMSAAEEPERRGLLVVGPTDVRFRHELVRLAIRSSVPVARRRRLHGEILEHLAGRGADPAEIVFHAEQAGNTEAVAEHALPAARRAAALSSNREAHAHYTRAAEFADRLPEPERAALYEEQASIAYLTHRLDEAFAAVEHALALHEQAADTEGIVRCRRLRSRLHWYAGNGKAAWTDAQAAVAMLEPRGESAELARAYSALGQLAMLSGRLADTEAWSGRAASVAERVGDAATRVHALVTIGVARVVVDPDDDGHLLAAVEAASALEQHHEAVRGLLGLADALLGWVRPIEAMAVVQRARGVAEQSEVDTLLVYLRAMEARLRLRSGDWSTAERLVGGEGDSGANVARLQADIALAELALRRGDDDAGSRLRDVAVRADATGELQNIEPVVELEVERALLAGEPPPVERVLRVLTVLDGVPRPLPSEGRRLLAWAAVAGLSVAPDPVSPAPHGAMARGAWAAAADAFGTVGWPYDRALCLSFSDDAASLTEALSIARELGAVPLERRVATRLRDLGLPVPHGPRRRTRLDPKGLTERQQEVLDLVAAGLTDAEIAERLVISRRTAEHHVAAILDKLGVERRRDAARLAAARHGSGAGSAAGGRAEGLHHLE